MDGVAELERCSRDQAGCTHHYAAPGCQPNGVTCEPWMRECWIITETSLNTVLELTFACREGRVVYHIENNRIVHEDDIPPPLLNEFLSRWGSSIGYVLPSPSPMSNYTMIVRQIWLAFRMKMMIRSVLLHPPRSRGRQEVTVLVWLWSWS